MYLFDHQGEGDGAYLPYDIERGGFVIEPKVVNRWKQLMITPYAQLSEDEKKVDREIARRYLNVALLNEIKRNKND
jgi:hypothetical protein